MKFKLCIVLAAAACCAVNQHRLFAQHGAPVNQSGHSGSRMADAPAAPVVKRAILPASATSQPLVSPFDSKGSETIATPPGSDVFPGGNCDLGGCGCDAPCGGCDTCGCSQCCCPTHTFFVFGEYLQLRPRDSEVAYAVAIDGPIVGPPPPPIQVSRVAVVNQNYQGAFRVGAGVFLDSCSSAVFTYTNFSSSQTDAITTNPPNVIRSLVAHPQSFSAATDFLSAAAKHDIDFDLFDADFVGVWADCDRYRVSWLAGLRYAELRQGFNSFFQDNGTEFVNTAIDFEGVGIRVGLNGERYLRRGVSIYGKSAASFLVGDFEASYLQGGSNDPVVVDTQWKSGRIVPILELELGTAWTSKCERFRISGGYVISAWFNTVKTDDFIQAVQSNDFVDLGDAMTFDGFTARAEVRF